MKNGTSLTVGIITKNEEKFIARCIESVRKIADEIIVVDTGSSDRTVSIAKRHGATVLRHKWKGNYAKARNVYIRENRSCWIFSLDADETIAARDLPLLKNLTRQKNADAFQFTARNYTSRLNLYFRWRPLDGTYPHEERLSCSRGFWINRPMRLFRNKGYSYDETVRVHERATESVILAGGVIRPTSIVIHNMNEDRGLRFSNSKQRKYLAFDVRQARRRRPGVHEYVNLAIGFASYTGDLRRAIHFLEKALDKNPRDSRANYLLAFFHKHAGRRSRSLSCLKKTLRFNPDDADAQWLRGVCLDELEKPERALPFAEKAIELVPSHPLYLNSLGVIYYHLGNIQSALKCFQKSSRVLPSFQNPRRNYNILKHLSPPTGHHPL